MLYINDQLPHVQQAKQQHEHLITCYIKRKIHGKTPASTCSDPKCKVCTSRIQKAPASPYLISILNQLAIDKIAGSTPADLLRIHRRFNKLYLGGMAEFSNADKKSLEKIFNYEWFSDNDTYNAYDLCKALKTETCIYCNRIYTSTVITKKGKKIIRPTLDHWFSHSSHPILGISFYNLIPSCSPCNSSVKLDLDFALNANIHPYVDQKVTEKYQLKSVYDKSLNTFKVSVGTKEKRIKDTFRAMKIEEIYEHHQSELADLDLLKQKYNKNYLKSLGNLLGTKLTQKEVYRMMFGVEYEDVDFSNRPLSKLKKDILDLKL